MLSKKMQQALNGQINKELSSAYLYLDMAATMAERGLGGFAHWFRVQEGEERGHALKLFDYLVQQSAAVTLEAIAKPSLKDTAPQALVAATLEHERFITSSVNALVDLAQADWKS
ncbi:MAG: ferritin [Kiritimatiellaeota bacterium]|nr:ferritin [Kiritimatiellota bacterium]